MGGKHKEREKRRSRDRSREKDRDKGRDKRKRSRDRDRERDRERRRSRSRDRDRESRKNRRKSRSRSRSRERKHRDRSRESDRKRRSRSRSPSHHSAAVAPPALPTINNHHLGINNGASVAAVAPPAAPATNFSQPRNDFLNLFGGTTDLALMQQELALNPHLLQRIAESTDLTAQLMKFNSEIAGINCNSNSSMTLASEKQTPVATAMNTPASFEASNSCDNSQDASQGGGAADGAAAERRRKKKSRWGGSDNDKTFIPGMPTVLPSTLSADQQEAYLVQLQIEEISRKLRTGDLGINLNEKERSPSPEPIYSSDGKRLNTREFRTKKKLEEQRHQLIVRMQCMNPDFKPPTDYKPPVIRVSDKVLIPQEEHPDINFVGLLIGPRGNTLKAMEKDTGAKIIIRGKGSVKEGKVGRKDGQPLPGEDEPLHAFITASNAESVKKAVDRIKDVIKQGIEVPEGHNDLRRMQLRELAQLNGTLRETDTPRCNNCGSTEHKSWLCPDKPNVTNNILCSMCGGAGHIAKDCRAKKTGVVSSPNKIDEEYMSLMAELGEGPPPESQQSSNNHKSHSSRFGLFEQRQAPRSLMGSASHHQQMHQPQQQQQPQAPVAAAPWSQAGDSLPVVPPIPPPPVVTQPPLPPQVAAPPPPMMPWMQPPPPGMEPQWPAAPAPPGTQPIIAAPPPPGTTAAASQAMFPWMGLAASYATPPLPPPPGTGMMGAGLLAPPPPPPPPV